MAPGTMGHCALAMLARLLNFHMGYRALCIVHFYVSHAGIQYNFLLFEKLHEVSILTISSLFYSVLSRFAALCVGCACVCCVLSLAPADVGFSFGSLILNFLPAGVMRWFVYARECVCVCVCVWQGASRRTYRILWLGR